MPLTEMIGMSAVAGSLRKTRISCTLFMIGIIMSATTRIGTYLSRWGPSRHPLPTSVTVHPTNPKRGNL